MLPKLSRLFKDHLKLSVQTTDETWMYVNGFPLVERWHVLYRNYEEDPVFGTDKCIRFYQEDSESNGEYPITFDNGQDTEPVHGKAKLEPSEGYTVMNRVLVFSEGQKDPLTVYTSYMDPDAKCGVTRSTYASDTACIVAVPESQLGKQFTACDFIYNLLCGPEKFPIHDDSC
ncbi:uncharacterized protein LOC115322288 [Ixodes scapularis]|uniref:uncharacterized protein LOC115322288 n=1 Tax=Ixodes scapularis TaxID=6945 RepID=UPI001A9D9CCF|nr:uncharacterized protein LOC115322288 [Ixodes scapularis]